MIVYGHRGARNEAPENTVAGFQYGYSVGLRAFELDVRLSADNELVVMHDASVARTTGVDKQVAELTRAERLTLDARGQQFPDWPTPCGVPTLNEVLAALPDDVLRIEVEIKRDSPERLAMLTDRLIPLVREMGWRDRVVYTSFDPEALRLVREREPDVPRSFIGAYDTPAFLETALELGCRYASMPVASGSLEMAQAIHQAGLLLVGWLGNTTEQLDTIIAWQSDATTTDNPGIALPYLRDKGKLD